MFVSFHTSSLIASLLALTTGPPVLASYLTQFPPEGLYQVECEGLASSLCVDLCSRCEGQFTKPLLEDCILEQSSLIPQGTCEIGVTLIIESAPAAGWTKLLPNTTYELTSILLSSRYLSTSISDLVFEIELTSDVNTWSLNDDYYGVPENSMPTTVVPTNTDDTPPQLTFAAYLMAEGPASPFNFDLCRSTKYNASSANLLSSALTYTSLSTPAPLPEPYPYTQVPHLITFSLDASTLLLSDLTPQPYWCLNLSWLKTPELFRQKVVISNVIYSARSAGAFKIQSGPDPELYPATAPGPGLECPECTLAGGVWCTGNPNKYDPFFDPTIIEGMYPYTKEYRCCEVPSICNGTLTTCDGEVLSVVAMTAD